MTTIGRQRSNRKFLVHRPDTERLQTYLDAAGDGLAATVIQLAWKLGLLRSEIQQLTWEQVDFERSCVALPDRTVPMEAEIRRFLSEAKIHRSAKSSFVVLSDRGSHPPTEQHLSYVCRQALDQAGQNETRLLDLRYDFIICQLQRHDWQYVSRISGVDVRTLKTHFSRDAELQISTKVQVSGKFGKPVDTAKLQRVIAGESYTLGGTAILLAWELGLYQHEIASLCWDMIDWEQQILRLATREVHFSSGIAAYLTALAEQNAPYPCRQVLLTPRAHKSVDGPALSKITRTILVRYGLDNVTLRDLRRDYEMRLQAECPILSYVKQHGCISRNEAMDLLDLTESQANTRLRGMVIRGALVMIGYNYYAPDAVVPPEDHETVILAYLANHGICRRKEIADLLRLPPQQTSRVLQKLVVAGKISRVGRRYQLPAPADNEGAIA